MPHRERQAWLVLCLLVGLLPACLGAPAPGSLPIAPNVTPTPFQPQAPDETLAGATAASQPQNTPVAAASPPLAELPAETLTSTPLPTQIPLPLASPTPAFSLWVHPFLPVALRQSVRLPLDFRQVEQPELAQLWLAPGQGAQISQWVYALVAPFPTLVDGVTSDELRQAWAGQATGVLAGRPLLVDESTLACFIILWGQPAPGVVQVLPSGDLLQAAWQQRTAAAGFAVAIVPFEALEPRWKVLAVDGQSPLRKNFDLATYPLTVPVSLLGEPALAEAVRMVYGATLAAASNRDPQYLTVVALTGVTALVRGTAYAMERKGILYPAQDIGAVLRAADITHISNEVPFAADCPFPDPLQQGMRFCSSTGYIALMEEVGTDIVELTGDHFQDWGNQAMLLTLEMYAGRGWGYYGGGANLDEGRRALLVEHNGNRLAFIGCNAKGGSFAQAGLERPGAAACGLDWMAQEIFRLRQEGYLPIVTFQHGEFYHYEADPSQKRDFRQMAQAGAAVVSGSQAHQPQAFEFLEQALIHYGLGNLFFDQYDVSLATRQGFIDQHVFYAGRYLGSELLSILFVDYARPRWMTPEERQELLQAVFTASGW